MKKGYCDPKIVEMNKVVDSEDQLPDETADEPAENEIVEIEGSMGSSMMSSLSVCNLELDEKAPYGIKNLPELWVDRLRSS